MFHIILLILKIIGIILLSIIGLIVLLLLIICLTPLRYEIYGQVNNSKESLAGRVKFGYFFNIINGQLVYKDGRPRYYVALFKKKLICSKKPKEEHTKEYEEQFNENATDEPVKEQEPKEPVKESTKEPVKEITDDIKVPYEGEITEDDFKYVEKDEIKEEPVHNNSTKSSEKENKERTENKKVTKQKTTKQNIKKKNRLKSISEKIKTMYTSICVKIRDIKGKKEIVDTFFNDKVHRKAILKIFKEVKVLLKKLKPYNLSGKVHYGFEDPELTGKVLAGISMALPYLGNDLDVEPDFNNELVYSGNLSFKGKIKISYFVSLCIKLAVRKSVWTLIFDAKHILDNMN